MVGSGTRLTQSQELSDGLTSGMVVIKVLFHLFPVLGDINMPFFYFLKDFNKDKSFVHEN